MRTSGTVLSSIRFSGDDEGAPCRTRSWGLREVTELFEKSTTRHDKKEKLPTLDQGNLDSPTHPELNLNQKECGQCNCNQCQQYLGQVTHRSWKTIEPPGPLRTSNRPTLVMALSGSVARSMSESKAIQF